MAPSLYERDGLRAGGYPVHAQMGQQGAEAAGPADGSPVAVFGTGVMAHGIARQCLLHGHRVVILSNSPERAEGVLARLARDAEHPGAGSATCDPDELTACALFMEATVEDLGVKASVLAGAERALPPDALMATTTSSLSITALGAALQRPERFLGLHFFNPVQKMRLVEVISGERTSEEATARGFAFVEGLGKHPLRFPDRAGFLVNRLLSPMLNRAAQLVERGTATAEDVDRAMTLGAGHPLGPLALLDLIGADVAVAIGRSIYEETRQPRDYPTGDLVRRAAAGRLGRKTGSGYHRYRRRRER